MESSQQLPPQPSQEELAEGLPEGYPPIREHLHPVDPLPGGLQDKLDRIMKDSENNPRPVGTKPKPPMSTV